RQRRQHRLERGRDRQNFLVAVLRPVDGDADRQPGFGHAGGEGQAGQAHGAAGGEGAGGGGERRHRRAVEQDGVILADLRGRQRRRRKHQGGDIVLLEGAAVALLQRRAKLAQRALIRRLGHRLRADEALERVLHHRARDLRHQGREVEAGRGLGGGGGRGPPPPREGGGEGPPGGQRRGVGER